MSWYVWRHHERESLLNQLYYELEIKHRTLFQLK